MAKRSDIFKWIAFGSLVLCIIGAFIVDVGKVWFVVSGVALLISFLSVSWVLDYMETMIEGFDMIIERLDRMQGGKKND